MSNITRRDPLDDFFRGFFVRPVEYGGGPMANAEAPQMRVDVKEQDDAYQVHAELPGIKKEDIHVHIDGPVVSISAERKQDKEVKEGERILRTERYFGQVSRSFQLGQDVDEGRATGTHTRRHRPERAVREAAEHGSWQFSDLCPCLGGHRAVHRGVIRPVIAIKIHCFFKNVL